jgi:trans-2,3-dihydro-3-hydroxyanthranilate isomerase
MATYPFMQVDAFTTRPLSGNPCAIVFEADDLSESQMLAIAREMNLSETAFVMRSQVADWRVRYFTVAEEIPLAGHPTIASAWALVETGRVSLAGATTHISLELQVGPLPVEIQAADGRVQWIVMTQHRPQFLATYLPERILPAFGLKPEDALPGVPMQTVSTGTPQLMIPLAGLTALRRVQPRPAELIALRLAGDWFSPHLFCLEGATPGGRTFARHFGVPPDLAEDPFTGSATGGMAAYLWHYGLIDTPEFVAEQGHWLGRPGTAHVGVVGPRDAIELVRVGGAAVGVLRGELIIG